MLYGTISLPLITCHISETRAGLLASWWSLPHLFVAIVLFAFLMWFVFLSISFCFAVEPSFPPGSLIARRTAMPAVPCSECARFGQRVD